MKPLSPRGERSVVLGVGTLSILLGTAVAGFMGWALAGGLVPPPQPRDMIAVDLAGAFDVALPDGVGAIVWLPPGIDAGGGLARAQLRYVRPDGTSVMLDGIDAQAAGLDVDVVWAGDAGRGRLWLDDGRVVVDVPSGRDVGRAPVPRGARTLGRFVSDRPARVRWVAEP